MRPASACEACRDRRKSCQRLPHNTSCKFCIKRRLRCSLAFPVFALDLSRPRVYESLSHSHLDDIPPRGAFAIHGQELPMNEWDFTHLGVNGLPDGGRVVGDTSSLESDSSLSLTAPMIRLNQLLYETNQLCVKVASGNLMQNDLEILVLDISASLADWMSGLPPRLRNTPENASFWMSQGCGRIFIKLHINYNHVAQLLYYPFLHGSQDQEDKNAATSTGLGYVQKCVQHSANQCQLVYQSREDPDSDVSNTLVSHVLVVASTVQIYMLLFSPEDAEISAARYRLERNFEIINLLRNYWPCVDASLSRLNVFHNACLRSKNKPFQLDWWMLRFALEYGRPMEEREMSLGGEGEAGLE